MESKKNGKLVILTGFSGAGKDTLMNLLLDKRADLKRVVTHTSRPIRAKEKNGVDYHFVKKMHFENMIAKNHLIEHVLYGSHYKGTSKKEFEGVLGGESLVWRIDMSRAAIVEETLRRRFDQKTGNMLVKRTIKFLVKTSNPHVALSRYNKRDGAKADVDEFKKRLDKDVQVWLKHKHRFPNVIVNYTGRQKEALNEILQIVGD